jgi:CRP-like cAMP-binding protein
MFYIISDELGYRCLLEKVSLILDIPWQLLLGMTTLIPVEIGKPLFWYGAKFEFWRTAHTVPTLGFRVTLNGKSIVYSGDTVWGSKLKQLLEGGVISQEFHDRIQNAPFLSSEVTFHDAGGGLIHPDLFELYALPEQIRARIVPTHLSEIPKEMVDFFQEIKPGMSWVAIEEGRMLTGDLLRVLSSPLFVGLSDLWRSVIVSQGKIIEYPASYTILEEGGAGKMFYVVVGGTVVVQINGEEVTELSTGDFFGEQSLLLSQPCSATIRTKTPVKVMAIPKDIFKEMADGTRLSKVMESIHKIRPVLMKISLLSSLPPSVQNEIAACAEQVVFKKKETIIRQGDDADFLYIVKSGNAKVTVNRNAGSMQETIANLGAGQVFGEMALLSGGKRTANVIALSEMEVLRIGKDNFHRLTGNIPMLMFSLGKLASTRQGKASESLFIKL